MMKKNLFSLLVFCLFIGACEGDFDPYCEGKKGSIEVKFEGTAGDFYMKEKTVSTISQDTIDLICSEVKNLKPAFSNARGSDYSITFRFIDPTISQRPVEMYRIKFPEEKFVFWVGVKHYQNDTLAKLLMEVVNVDEIRRSDKYKIEKW
ncbi:MAG: hypothetical protein WA004_08640 [Saprospiraceae bacterium]